MLVTAVARAANCKLRLAATAALEANRGDTSSTRSTIAVGSTLPYRALGLALHACLSSDRIECAPMSSDQQAVISSAKTAR
jgi:hypothetical protein